MYVYIYLEVDRYIETRAILPFLHFMSFVLVVGVTPTVAAKKTSEMFIYIYYRYDI